MAVFGAGLDEGDARATPQEGDGVQRAGRRGQLPGEVGRQEIRADNGGRQCQGKRQQNRRPGPELEHVTEPDPERQRYRSGG